MDSCRAGFVIRHDFFLLALVRRRRQLLAEEKCDAPDAGQTDERIDDAAENGGLSPEEPCDEVEAEDPDQTPVQRTDDAQNQCNCIRNNPSKFLCEASMRRKFGQYSKNRRSNL